MLRVGLTGGIGSGKSAATRLLQARGAYVIDADVLAREALALGTPGLAEVVEAFGDGVLDPGGALDRPALGKRVFGDDEARATLNGIVHPRVGERTSELLEAAPAGAIVVHDVPLLVENGLAPVYDVVVVVDAADDVRVARLVEQRGMDADDVRSRMAAQASREDRLAAADEVLDNNGGRDALAEQVDTLWERLTARRDSDRGGDGDG